jgi:HlyD family secretion protein
MDRPIAVSTLRKHRAWIVGGGALLLFISLALSLRESLASTAIRLEFAKVSIGTVEAGVLHDFMPLRVAVVPRDIVLIDAPDGGRVEKVLVAPGDVVSAGQPLVLLSNTQLELQVLEHEGRLIESTTQLQNYQHLLEQNRLSNEMALSDIEYNITRLSRAVERRMGLVRDGTVSRESVDQLQDELQSYRNKHVLQVNNNREQAELRRKQMPTIHSQIAALQRDLLITREKLENLTARAPDSGRVTSLDLKVGQTLRPGDRIAQMSRDTGFKLSQPVDEFYLPRLHAGQAGVVTIDDRDWPVAVSRLHPEIKNGTFTVDFEFTGQAPPDLLPGRTLQGRLTFGSESNVLYVPAGPFLERSGGAWVFVVDSSNGSAKRRNIRIGRRNPDQVEVIEGLRAGERILVSDYTGLDRADRIDFN